MANLTVQQTDGGVVFTVKVVPGSSKTSNCGLLDGMLKIKIAAAPERGKANDCLIRFLAELLGVKKNCVRIISGKTSAVKSVQVDGITAEDLLTKLDLSG